jgi:chromosome segregation ATPase
MPLNINPSSFDMLPMLLLNPVSALSQVWQRLEEMQRELNTAEGSIRSLHATAGYALSEADRSRLTYAQSVLFTQQQTIRQRQVEVSQAMNEVDTVKNLLNTYIPEMQRLIRDEQKNYERNHELQEQLDELKDELKRRGIVL